MFCLDAFTTYLELINLRPLNSDMIVFIGQCTLGEQSLELLGALSLELLAALAQQAVDAVMIMARRAPSQPR